MKKIISFDLEAEMGFLKKPDINEGIYLTYNMLHKPAVLGILGAILGLEGFKRNSEMAGYYLALRHLKIGVEPLYHLNGNFGKTTVKFTDTTGFSNKESNLLITEQILIKPSYRVYVLLDLDQELEKKLYNSIKDQQAVFLPYLGKNEFSMWWNRETVKEYDLNEEKPNSNFKITTVFKKSSETRVGDMQEEGFIDLFEDEVVSNYFYFERLPVTYSSKLFQYETEDFTLTNANLKKGSLVDNLYAIENNNYVQLN